MATCTVQSIIEKNPFAIDLFNFLFNALNHARAKIPNRDQSFFNEDIGDAVLYLQFISRDCIFKVLTSNYIYTTEDALHVTRKLCRIRRKKHPDQILQVFLECCAIITEVYLYCVHGIHLDVETSMVFLAWNFVFNRRRIKEFLAIGGWDELTAYAVHKFHKKIDLFNMDVLLYPNKRFMASQTKYLETETIAVDFKESFVCFTENRELEVDARERHRQSKASMRMKRVEDRLVAEKRMGTTVAEAILTSQTRMALRSASTVGTMDWVKRISPYNSSQDDDDVDTLQTISQLCTKMSDAKITSSAKKKKPKKKKQPKMVQAPLDPSLESPEKDNPPSVSSSRPVEVPVHSPATSLPKMDKPDEIPAAEAVSPGQSKVVKKSKTKKSTI